MKRTEFLARIAGLFCYKTIRDPAGREYVVLADSPLESIAGIEDKTAFEAVENHVHLLDRIRKEEFEVLIPVAERLGTAVLAALERQYPEKRFHVFVSLRLGDAMILRFHQQWENELPYYNPADFASGTDRVLGFSN